jgi:3-hydroxy-9,10-secoandrosta-1,3,5(10)-triene-9,17-dione monooxygenase reductase component
VSEPVEPPVVEDVLGPAPVDEAADSLATAHFRRVLGHFATGVTIVTGIDGEEPLGLSVSSLTSVSLRPPLVAFCITRESSTWPRIDRTGRCCVNVLADDQEDLARLFAARGPDRFRSVGWRPAPSGCPVVNGVLAWIDCTVVQRYDGGDHVIVLGGVEDLGVEQEGRPLIFYRGGYGRFES